MRTLQALCQTAPLDQDHRQKIVDHTDRLALAKEQSLRSTKTWTYLPSVGFDQDSSNLKEVINPRLTDQKPYLHPCASNQLYNHSVHSCFMRFTLLLPLLILLAVIPYSVMAQELDCEIAINREQVTGNAFDYMSELAPQLEQYINETSWTDYRLEEHERIGCTLQIVLTSASDDFVYGAQIVVISRRPIYNTMQETQIVVLNDERWQFEFPRGKSLIRDDLQFDSFTSTLDFYIYMILGFDFDSFAPLGGTEFFNKAAQIRELGEQEGALGWGKEIGAQRNRFGLISDVLNPTYDPLRQAFYDHHRQVLDIFTLDPEKARQNTLATLELLRDAKRLASSTYVYDVWFNAKAQEYISIFRDADSQVRTEALLLLQQVDPSNTSKYEALQP